MKKILPIILCLCAYTCYSQTILKAKIPVSATPAPAIDSNLQKAVNLFDTAVKHFKDTPNISKYAIIDSLLRTKMLDTLPKAKKMLDSIRADSVNRQALNYPSIAKIIDTIKLPVPQPIALCPKLAGMNIRFVYGNGDSYIGVLEDTSGNAQQSFVLTQSNKALFYDMVGKAMREFCDSSNVATIINTYIAKGPDLYTQYLEAKESFSNTNGLAGTLRINKKVPIRASGTHGTAGSTPANPKLDYNSMAKAQQEMEKALNAATSLRATLDSLRKSAVANAKNAKDSAWANLIGSIYADVQKKLDYAIMYRDSISRIMPDSQTAVRYNQAIELSHKAEKAANDAIKAIKKIATQLESSGAGNSHGPSTVHTLKIPLNTLQAIGEWYSSTDDSIPMGILKPDKDTLNIQSIQIQFQDGFIENIKVYGRVKNDKHLFRFENVYPIGFSTKKDFKKLVDISLVETSDYKHNQDKVLLLGEVLGYDENLAVNNKDYSPANQVLTIDALTDSVKEVPLYKDQTSKILELQVFSDLKGANNENPNGLIQIELAKKLNLFSWRCGVTPKIWPWNWCNGKHYEYMANLGLFNFLTPSFTIDKIEENQKRLILSHVDTLSRAQDTSKPITYASTIDLLRHQIYSIGVDLSALTLDFPNIKSTVNFGIGFRLGRTSLQDTLRLRDTTEYLHFTAAPTNNVIQYGVNTFQWGPYVTWQVFPDSRFGIWGTQRFAWYNALSSNFVQVRDSAHYLNFVYHNSPQIRTAHYSFSKCIASAEIFAYFSPNSDGSNKLFFRYRLNWDVANPRQNFQQLQLGFSTYLTATKEYDKLKKSVDVP